jgi:alpha-tubulin suppressor-like RCC1 family protein
MPTKLCPDSCARKPGVWSLQNIRDKVIAQDLSYNPVGDPGSLWKWGTASYGQLGDNSTIPKSSPVQIPGSWRCAVSSSTHTMAIKSDTTLWAWGRGSYGALGENTTITYSSPIQVPGNQWKCVTVGTFRSMGTKGPGACASYNGQLWTWGRNNIGQSGDNTNVTKSSLVLIPGSNWDIVEASSLHTLALKCDGTLWAWGSGIYGALGDGTCINRSSPIQIPGTQWVSISASQRNSYALKSDGTLWGWGKVDSVGDNNAAPTPARLSPTQVPGNQWVDIQSARYSAMGRKTDNTLWVWGSPTYHDLAIDAGVHKSSPVQLPGNQWRRGGFAFAQMAALKNDGTLWVAGNNAGGQLGDGTTIAKVSPVQIPGIWSDVTSNGSCLVARKSL